VVQKYALVASGDSFVIVARPHNAYGYVGVDKNVNIETVRRLTYYLLILTNMLRTSDANHVSYSPTRARFVVITGLLTIELLGLQDGYLVGKTTNVNYEWEAAGNESLVGGQGDGDVTCNC
jgi:hypothetical protein